MIYMITKDEAEKLVQALNRVTNLLGDDNENAYTDRIIEAEEKCGPGIVVAYERYSIGANADFIYAHQGEPAIQRLIGWLHDELR